MRKSPLLVLLTILTGPAMGQEASDTDYVLPSLDTVRALAERPLFVPGRRGAIEADRAPAIPSQQPHGQLVLAGIGRRGDGRGVALLRLGSMSRTLAPGQDWTGWTLVSVGDDRVELRSADGTAHTLHVGRSIIDPETK